jgi:hypothetical protein
MKKKIERVGFVIKPHAPRIKELLEELYLYFKDHGIDCLFEEVAVQKLRKGSGLKREEIPGNVDLVVVLGGDGTLLSIAHLAAKADVPVVGVNLGNLGFLTEVPLDEMYLTFESLFEGEEKIVSRRQMLEVMFKEETFFCLNDVVINKGALAHNLKGRWTYHLDTNRLHCLFSVCWRTDRTSLYTSLYHCSHLSAHAVFSADGDRCKFKNKGSACYSRRGGYVHARWTARPGDGQT